MDSRASHRRAPTLRRPVLIAAFRGWNDGGQAATLAAGYARPCLGGDPLRRDRPGGVRRLPVDAPDRHARRGHDPPDRVARDRPSTPRRSRAPTATPWCCIGVEPNYRWRTFNELVVGLARELGVELVVTLGALLADVPHTRPAPVTGAASDPSLVEELGLQTVALRRPDRDRRRAPRRVPPGGAPVGEPLVGGAALRLARAEPRAARALCDRLGELLGVPIDLVGARRGGGGVRGADHRGGRLGSRDRGVRRGARAPRGHDRRAIARTARICRRGVARGRADAVPAGPRERDEPPAGAQ